VCRKHQLYLSLPEVLAGRPTSESASIPDAAASSTSAEEPLAPEEPQTLTFAQLKALIEQGRTDEIPNNKHIPDVLSVRVFLASFFGSLTPGFRRTHQASRIRVSGESPGRCRRLRLSSDPCCDVSPPFPAVVNVPPNV
jgi:hypothetical protein